MTNKQKIIKWCAVILAGFIIINILSLIMSIFTSISSIFFNNDDLRDFSEEYTNVERIEIDKLNASIIIREGSSFRVDATNVSKEFRVKLKDDTLKIEEDKLLLGINNDSSKLIITIPDNYILDELSIDTGASNVRIDNIKVREFEIDQGVGMLEINNSIMENTSIDGGAGEIKIINSTLKDLDLDSGVGKVKIEANIRGNNEISCGVGDVDITLFGNEKDYSIDIDKGIGSIKIDNKEVGNNTSYGNGYNKLDIDGGIGSINISFN